MKYNARLVLAAGLLAAAPLVPSPIAAQPEPDEAAAAPAPPPVEAPVPRVTAPPAPVTAAPDSAAAPVPVAAGAAIRGRVLIAGTDTPLPFVEITVRGPDGPAVTELTGDDGSFAVAGLAPGRYRLEVVADGFAAASKSVALGTVDALVTLTVSTSETIQVTGRWRGEAQEMRESAEAVQVVETDKAARESADLGDVLARVQGVGVRRAGGLGSAARLSMAGLSGEKVRFFLDGVPFELAGFRSGVTTIPVNFVDRIEIYRGVVPVRFGSDALGGAMNFVTNRFWTRDQASASYQVGSFGTHRVTAAGRGRHRKGLVSSADVFFDSADNDYPIDVEVANDRGQLSDATVRRSHDQYRSYGGFAEAGVVDQPWARRLTLRGFATRYDKDLQHNAVMTVPYGEARYGGSSVGAMLRWEQPGVAGTELGIDTVLAYSFNATDFVDRSEWVYDWFGDRVYHRATRAGETDSEPSDQTLWDHNASTITNLDYPIAAHHKLRANVTVSAARRSGRERLLSIAATRDPLSARRILGKGIAGVEYVADGWSDRFENVAAAKGYGYLTSTEEVLAGGIFRDLERRDFYWGVGDGLRWRFTDWLWGKASYEWTTRLPDPYEVFGDGVLIAANLELQPERSHNGNLGVAIDVSSPRLGKLKGELGLFARLVDNEVLLLGNDRYFTYQNAYETRNLGVDLALAWTAPGDWLSLAATATYADCRNASDQGVFGDFEGDRIPSKPYLNVGTGVELHHAKLFSRRDSITGSLNSAYVHEFFRGWESQGLRAYKQVVDSQLLHSLVVTYLTEAVVKMSFSVELENLTDSQAFDFYGIQKPGRSLSFKTTVQY